MENQLTKLILDTNHTTNEKLKKMREDLDYLHEINSDLKAQILDLKSLITEDLFQKKHSYDTESLKLKNFRQNQELQKKEEKINFLNNENRNLMDLIDKLKSQIE